MNLIEYADREMMMMVLAGKLAGELGAMLRQQGHASLCVPGGTTPGPVFDLLSAVDMDWGLPTMSHPITSHQVNIKLNFSIKFKFKSMST